MSIRMYSLTDANGKVHQVSEGIYQQILRAGGIDEVLEDGERVRVNVLLRDGQPFHGDADPRFAPVTDAMREEIELARREYISRISSAWKGDAAPSAVADSTPNLPRSPMRTLPPQPQPRQPVRDDREQAYNEYCEFLRTAWKAGKEEA